MASDIGSCWRRATASTNGMAANEHPATTRAMAASRLGESARSDSRSICSGGLVTSSGIAQGRTVAPLSPGFTSRGLLRHARQTFALATEDIMTVEERLAHLE